MPTYEGPKTALGREIHSTKYRTADESFDDYASRVAGALSNGHEEFKTWRDLLGEQRFLPGGRIQSAIGSPRQVTAINCLAGETLCLTSKGVFSLESLAGKTAYLLDGNNEWVEAPIHYHGIQETCVVRLACQRKSAYITATPNHDWILADGSKVKTSELRLRDQIQHRTVVKNITHEWLYTLGLRHGFVYGDGSTHTTGFTVRVCKAAAKLADFMLGIPKSFPPSCNGDPVYYFYGDNVHCDMKELPENQDHDYLLGFIRGLFLADGCISKQPEVMITGEKDLLNWLYKWGPVVGWYPTGWSKLSSRTNFGIRTRDTFNIRFDLRSIIPDDLLRDSERLIDPSTTNWSVREILRGEAQAVYCPSVPTTQSFTLGNGIHIGNCFVSGTIEDNMNSIMRRAAEAAQVMRLGGGIGYDFSGLRPEGDRIRSLDSKSSGPVSFMGIYDAICKTISSAGHRRGAQMGVLRVDHPDIRKFIRAKRDEVNLTGFNMSIGVTDHFIECLLDERPFALRFGGRVYEHVDPVMLWDEIMRNTWDWAEPGVIFLDTVNRMNNLWYFEKVSASNPCVTKDTWVLTQEGPRQVASLIGEPFTVMLNGSLYETVSPGFFKTGTKPVFRLTTKEGFSLRLTAEHEVLVVMGKTRDTKQFGWCAAQDLIPGDQVVLNNNRTIQEWKGLHHYGWEAGYLVGSLISDGHFKSDGQVVLGVWPGIPDDSGIVPRPGALGRKAQINACLEYLDTSAPTWANIKERGEYRLYCKTTQQIAESLDLSYDNKVITTKVEECSSDFYCGFLRGLFDCDGSVQGTQQKGISVRLSQSNLSLLEAVQRMLARLGIVSNLYPNRRPAGKRLLPNGKGGSSYYDCLADHELIISKDNLHLFQVRVGFSDTTKSETLSTLLQCFKRKMNAEQFIAVVEAVSPDGEEDVYDVTVDSAHAFEANGIIAHNCGEQMLPPYGSCLLGSFNLVKYIHRSAGGTTFAWGQFATDIAHAVVMMDRVIDLTLYPLPKQQKRHQQDRRMGLGVTGLANAGEAMGHPYGSEGFLLFTEAVLGQLRDTAYQTSIDQARELGPFPAFKPELLDSGFAETLPQSLRDQIATHGLRNSHLISMAPTGTISIAADNVSASIEPPFSIEYERTVLGDNGPTVEKVTDYAWREWGLRGRTANELAPAEHLAVLTTAQRFTDSAVSKTLNIGDEVGFEDFKKIYLDAWAGGAKGCTTFRAAGRRMGVLKATDGPAVGGACSIDPVTGERSCE